MQDGVGGCGCSHTGVSQERFDSQIGAAVPKHELLCVLAATVCCSKGSINSGKCHCPPEKRGVKGKLSGVLGACLEVSDYYPLAVKNECFWMYFARLFIFLICNLRGEGRAYSLQDGLALFSCCYGHPGWCCLCFGFTISTRPVFLTARLASWTWHIQAKPTVSCDSKGMLLALPAPFIPCSQSRLFTFSCSTSWP